MDWKSLFILLALSVLMSSPISFSQTMTSTTTTSTFVSQPVMPQKVTIGVNVWYTLPFFVYAQYVGEVYVLGQANVVASPNYTSVSFNFTSTGYLLTPSGLKELPIQHFVLAVFPTGNGIYVLSFNASSVAGNITNSSGKMVFNVTPIEEELWYYNGGSPTLALKGNITSILPYSDGIYAVERIDGKPFLLDLVNGKVVSNVTLPEPLFLLYKGQNYLLASTSAFSISPSLLMRFVTFSTSMFKKFTEIKFYEIFPNGTLTEVKPNINTINATLLALPGELYGADLYVVYSNGTYALYLYNGTSLFKVVSGTNEQSSTTPSFVLPFALASEGVIAYSTTTFSPAAIVSGGSMLSSLVTLLVNVNGSWVKYGSVSVNGVPLAMTKNGSIVTLYYVSVSPSYGLSSGEVSVSIATSIIPTKVYVGKPITISYSLSTETIQGKKYLVITWTQPSVQVPENVSVYVSVNGGPYRLYEEVPVSTGMVYFPLPSNATNVSVYLVVKNAMGSVPLAAKSVSLVTSTKAPPTTTTPTTPPSSTASPPTSSATTLSFNGLEIAAIAIVIIVIIAIVALFLLRRGK